MVLYELDVQQDARNQNNSTVNLSYSDDTSWVSVSGKATKVLDRDKMKELWQDEFTMWFPQGLHEPDLALLNVHVEEAEYWDVTSKSMLRIFGYAKAKLTGKPYEGELSEHGKVKL